MQNNKRNAVKMPFQRTNKRVFGGGGQFSRFGAFSTPFAQFRASIGRFNNASKAQRIQYSRNRESTWRGRMPKEPKTRFGFHFERFSGFFELCCSFRRFNVAVEKRFTARCVQSNEDLEGEAVKGFQTRRGKSIFF